jgi:hypothetical protein
MCGRKSIHDPETGLEIKKAGVKYYFTIKERPEKANFVLVDYRISGQHDHSRPSIQIRGKEREELRNEILNSDNGSCKEKRLKMLGEAGPLDYVPTEFTLRKIKSEKNNVDWERLLRTTWKSHNAALGDGKLQGFIEMMRTCPQLEVVYLLKEQMLAIDILNQQNRILFIDNMDKMVFIPKK